MNNEKGFTLLEILVALTILGIATAIILQQFSAGLKVARLTQEYTNALIHAREKLEEHSLSPRLSEKEESGEFEDGYRWQVIVAPYEEKSDQDTGTEFLLLSMYKITSRVSWMAGDRERKVELETIKIVPKEGWK